MIRVCPRVGRNIGEGIFADARQGLNGQGSAVVVEAEVFDGVVVNTEVDRKGAQISASH